MQVAPFLLAELPLCSLLCVGTQSTFFSHTQAIRPLCRPEGAEANQTKRFRSPPLMFVAHRSAQIPRQRPAALIGRRTKPYGRTQMGVGGATYRRSEQTNEPAGTRRRKARKSNQTGEHKAAEQTNTPFGPTAKHFTSGANTTRRNARSYSFLGKVKIAIVQAAVWAGGVMTRGNVDKHTLRQLWHNL